MNLSEATLYDRIGGKGAIEAAVDLFYEKVIADETLASFFENLDMNKQIGKQKIFLAFVFGGPVKYDGRDMREAHMHLNLQEEHFASVAGHLQATLEELNVPADLIQEVMTIAASTHDDVLNIRAAA